MKQEEVARIIDRVKHEVGKVIIGHEETIEMLMVSLLCEGHVLLEGVPGTAKTLLAQTFARCSSLKFGRIQFTPDLMPGDIIGTNLFNFQTNQFSLLKGPVFTELLLADEINRTPPKTQAALLQAMQERNVTIDNVTFALGDVYMVIATQNPIEQQGTYPLPEAQLDRFLFKLKLTHPQREEEIQMVVRHGNNATMPDITKLGVSPVLDIPTILEIRALSEVVTLRNEIIEYIVDICRATRSHQAFQFGGSTRSIKMLASAVRSYALIKGRDFVIPDDVKDLFIPVMRHRVILSPMAEIEGVSADVALGQVLEQQEVPN